MKKISTAPAKVKQIVADKRYDRYIKKMQKNIGPYVPTPHVVQIWA